MELINMLMKIFSFFGVLLIANTVNISESLASAQIGEKAPEFTATDIYGNEVKLSDFAGKPIVMEWTNHDCPFVVKQYDSGNMQKIQNDMAEKEVAWIRIVSSAPGKQGNVTSEKAKEIIAKTNAVITTQISDESGEIGKMYGAKTTPHMFVIDSEGVLAYAGAIDSEPSLDKEIDENTQNYVVSAINSLMTGETPNPSMTKPYGCSVKY